MTTERIISSDSHVNVQHDDVKERLATRFHDEYDAALMQYARELLGGNAAKANQAGTEIQHASWSRPGHADPHERLATWTSTASTSRSLYCEVSAYRYLYLLEDRRARRRHARSTTRCTTSRPPTRRGLIVRTRCRSTTSTSPSTRSHASPAMGGKSLQLPVFPAELGQPDYFHERYDRMWAAISRRGLPICCHIGLNTALDQLADRDPTPRLAWTLSCMPLYGVRGARHVAAHRHPRPLPRPEDRLRRTGARRGWRATSSFLDDMVLRQGYEFPVLDGELPSFYYHRNMAMTFIDEPDPVRHLRHVLGARTSCGRATTRTRCRRWPKSLAVIDEHVRAVCPTTSATSWSSGNAARIWNL